MDYLISVSFGELTLKGDNRKDFENRIIRKIKKAIADFEVEEFYKEQGKVYIKADRELFDEMIEQIKKVFGIFYICEVLRTEKKLENIREATRVLVSDLGINEEKTFKVFVNRVDKKFTPKSPELSRDLGGVVLKNFGNLLKVDVHNPQMPIFVDVKEYVVDFQLAQAEEDFCFFQGELTAPLLVLLWVKEVWKLEQYIFIPILLQVKEERKKLKTLQKYFQIMLENLQ